MKLEHVVIVTDHNGVFECILDCGIVESWEAANEAIREAKEDDARLGWQFSYRPVPVTRANGTLCKDCGKNPVMNGCSVCAECGL